MSGKKFTTYDLVVVGMMAAVCFAATFFFKIGPIPTPAGPTMIKLGNGFCLLGGLLFGGLRGGLSAGIGCMIFDLMDPVYLSSAPFTLVFYFIMASVCGIISHSGGRNGMSLRWNLLAAICGATTYLFLHLSKSVLALVIAGSNLTAAIAACSTKLITSGINAAVGVVVSLLLASVLRTALERAGFYHKLESAQPKAPTL